MLVDTERAADLDAVMDQMLTGDDAYRYSVAWIDCQSTGGRLGRSVLTRGDHARLEDLPDAAAGATPTGPGPSSPGPLARVPLTPPSGLLNPLTVGAFNEFWFRKAPRPPGGQAPPHGRLLPPPRRRRRTGTASTAPRGFLQYQFVVPDAARRDGAAVIERLTRAQAGLASWPCSSGSARATPGPSRSPCPGGRWPSTSRSGTTGSTRCSTTSTTRSLAAGGRVYLAKDSRVSPAAFRAMYPGSTSGWRCGTGSTPTGCCAPTSAGGSACAATVRRPVGRPTRHRLGRTAHPTTG